MFVCMVVYFRLSFALVNRGSSGAMEATTAARVDSSQTAIAAVSIIISRQIVHPHCDRCVWERALEPAPPPPIGTDGYGFPIGIVRVLFRRPCHRVRRVPAARGTLANRRGASKLGSDRGDGRRDHPKIEALTFCETFAV